MKFGVLITIFIALSAHAAAKSLEHPFSRAELVAATKALAGGSIGVDQADNYLNQTVALRLIARGMMADAECGMKNQADLVAKINDWFGLKFRVNDDGFKADVGLIQQGVENDFLHLGKDTWCSDYKARAQAANNLFQ
jgi:hypothetical protein